MGSGRTIKARGNCDSGRDPLSAGKILPALGTRDKTIAFGQWPRQQGTVRLEVLSL
jgi:hypothetical protein